MAKEEHVELSGEIVSCGKGGIFKVLSSTGHTVLARMSGKMRQNKIRIVLGDKVLVSVSPYDPSKGFITFREK